MMKNNFFKNYSNSGQGTIEYLVIIAVVIVIGLVVANMATGMFDQAQITRTSDSLKEQIGSGGISVIDSIANYEGTGLLSLRNTGSEVITLTKITTEDAENEYNLQWPQGNTNLIQTENLCICGTGQTQKTCEFTFYLTTRHGIEKKVTQTITIQCEEEAEPTKEPTLPTHCFNINNNPIKICSLQDLNQIRTKLDGNYILMKDIDANETITWDEGNGWEPIGTYATKFTGNFNGNNYKINNLYVNRLDNEYIGFFGYALGNISNIGLENINIVGGDYVGGLVGGFGWYDNPKTISNSYTTGNVNGETSVGGIVGYLSNGLITNSYSNVIISEEELYFYVGGLVGQSHGGQIFNSYTTGEINLSDGWSVGGLMGDMVGGHVENSYSTVNITIDESEAIGVGGLIGYFGGGAKVNNSYSTGTVNVDVDILLEVGGFMGWDNSNHNPVNSGWWTGAGPNSAIGEPDGNITYNENNASAFYNSLHGVYTATEPHWTFGEDGNWIVVTENYPILKWQTQ
jgi:hypothetical protein